MTWAATAAAIALAVVPVSGDVASRTVYSFDDPAITESSGLVDLGRLMVTINDSGGDPLVFVVDSRTGRTVATTTFASSVVDTEALAPAGPDAVWVGDIGDNNAVRSSVQVYRVPVGATSQTLTAPSYELVYPDGAHDAESLVQGPDGRLRIITKGILGGRVYLAPKNLDPDRPNRLRPGPPVDMFATDAALFPDGRHILVRGYSGAMVATFPGFKVVAQFGLPPQEQGEGVSIAGSGRIRLSSEGEHAPVLQITLPTEVAAAMKLPTKPAETGSTGLDASGAVDSDEASGVDWGTAGIIGGTVLVLLAGWRVLRRRA